ncbi:sensor histidine kinase [Streptomyces fulvorobeus]|uniref:GAF domain-containing protein n=1 Tax=Streptomyces fulvorobeus TaxID=284028 RepID=A0A7J0C329_9ACTN|nr:GAF domain-containing protein [Streptomyces fulvorobeus]NYE40596.1 GAF domain-containing protein [Streptomyces fulvorobeus]GFM96890.1 histidine kinase [Streptomyces fulvorobeus]
MAGERTARNAEQPAEQPAERNTGPGPGRGSGRAGGAGAPGAGPPRLPELLAAVLSVGSDLDQHATLQRIVDTATALTEARNGVLGVLDPVSDRVTELYTAGLTDTERQRVGRLPDGRRGASGLLAEDPRLPRCDDVSTDPGACGVPPGHPAMRAFLCVPIRVHDEVFGTLYLADKRSGRFDDTDTALLRVLAAQAGIALGNARLYATARQRERWIEGAAAVTTALLTGADATDALRTVAERARVLAGASAGVILQPRAGGGMEIVTASTPHDPAGIVGTVIEPGSPVLVQLLAGEPVFVDDSSSDPRMTTPVRSRFGPSMMLPLRSGGRLIGTLALPRGRGEPPYSAVERTLASQFASHAALALVLADSQHDREQLAVYEDRDRIARDLHDLVVQRLFATEMMLESTRRRVTSAETDELLTRAVDELDSTIQEVRTTIFALQQPPAEVPATFRGRVLRETGGAAAVLGFQPSVHFAGAVDALVGEPAGTGLLTALRGALAAAHRRAGVHTIEVEVDATARTPAGGAAVRLVVADDGREEDGTRSRTVTWQAPL